MSNDKTSDAMQKAMQDALASVERIERERVGSADEQEPTIETEIELPEPGDEPDGAAAASSTEDEATEPPAEDSSSELAEELERVRGQLLRLAADFENFRKRSQREREETRQFGVEAVLRDFLPVVDNLNRALSHAPDDSDPLAQGVRMICKLFADALAAHGARPFDSEGQPFDPEQHEAMSQAPSAEVAPGMVLHELEKGYRLHERLLRPAKVIVAAAPPVAAEERVSENGADEETDESEE